MMLDEIETKIHGRIAVLKELLEYNSNAINEAIATVNELDYLFYLKESFSNEKTD